MANRMNLTNIQLLNLIDDAFELGRTTMHKEIKSINGGAIPAKRIIDKKRQNVECELRQIVERRLMEPLPENIHDLNKILRLRDSFHDS